MSSRERPSGVVLLAALHFSLGSLLVVGFLAMAIIRLGLPNLLPLFRLLPIRPAFIAMVLVAFSIIEFTLAFGLWSGMSWAWLASLIFAALGMVLSVFSLFLRPGLGELISLIIDLLILYYLMQPRVKAYFGRRVVSSTILRATVP